MKPAADVLPAWLTEGDVQAGADAVLKQIDREQPRRILVLSPNALVPKRVTRGQIREMLLGMKTSVKKPVIVTSRLRGTDMVVRTMEWTGDAGTQAVPTSPTRTRPISPDE